MTTLLVAQPYCEESPADNVHVAHAALRGFLDTITPDGHTEDGRMSVRASDVYWLLQPTLHRLATAEGQLLGVVKPLA